MKSNSESDDGGAQCYVSGRQVFALCIKLLAGVVSLSTFGGNFVLAKVQRLGLISVCFMECPLLRGSKCISFVVKSIGGK